MAIPRNSAISVGRIPEPPLEYDPAYMNQLVRALEMALAQLAALGVREHSALLLTGENIPTLIKSPLSVKNIPTSSAGLNTGDVWSDAGDLKIV